MRDFPYAMVTVPAMARRCLLPVSTVLMSGLEFGNISSFLLGGAVVNALTFSLGHDSMQAWGLCIPFVIAGVAGPVAPYLRLNVDESPVFRQMSRC